MAVFIEMWGTEWILKIQVEDNGDQEQFAYAFVLPHGRLDFDTPKDAWTAGKEMSFVGDGDQVTASIMVLKVEEPCDDEEYWEETCSKNSIEAANSF